MNITEQPANRTGVKTTEFWLVLLVNLMTPLMAYLDKIDGLAGLLITGLVTGLYAALRSGMKTNLLNKTAPTPGNEEV